MLVRTTVAPELVSTDEHFVPRYWATVWSFKRHSGAASLNTRQMQLRHIDSFYDHCDKEYGIDWLDAAITMHKHAELQDMVETFHMSLSERSDSNTTTVQKWAAVRGFVQSITGRLAPGSEAWRALAAFVEGMEKIRPNNFGRIKFVYALSQRTLGDLLDVAEPGSGRNPWKGIGIQRRNWLAINLLLFCGLRRGELLLLTVDSLNEDVEPTSGELVHWLNVTSCSDDDEFHNHDPRANKPSIKTEASHRQIPVSKDLADLYISYVTDFREPSDTHGFLITARGGAPLSVESVNKFFRQLSKALSDEARAQFRKRAGGKKHVSPHDMRHTAATGRYISYRDEGSDILLVKQRMRAYFGWDTKSDMPDLYARAAIQEDLLRSWSDVFELRTVAGRSLISGIRA